jgi:cytochrome c biogenesis protein CcmG, thiol:disulfide interchange protein DsbE
LEVNLVSEPTESEHFSPNEPQRPRRGVWPWIAAVAATFWGGLLLLVVLSVLAFLFLPSLLQRPLHIGQPAAGTRRLSALQLQPLVNAEGPVSLADLSGKVVVLNFWGTWCGPCLLELPHVVHLDRVHRGQDGFRLLAVSCGRDHEDLEDLRAKTAALFKRESIDMPVYADMGFVTRGALDKLEPFTSYPTTVVLDRRGVVRDKWVGFDRDMPRDLEQLIQRLLAEEP